MAKPKQRGESGDQALVDKMEAIDPDLIRYERVNGVLVRVQAPTPAPTRPRPGTRPKRSR